MWILTLQRCKWVTNTLCELLIQITLLACDKLVTEVLAGNKIHRWYGPMVVPLLGSDFRLVRAGFHATQPGAGAGPCG